MSYTRQKRSMIGFASRVILLLLLILSSASAADLVWNASVVDETHGTPDGYRIYYGSRSGIYTLNTEAGNVLQWHIPDSWPAGNYYFAATAYNAGGESTYSNEAVWTKSAPQSIQPASGGYWQLAWIGSQQMGFSFVASATGGATGSGSSIATTSTLTILAGDVLVCLVGFEDTSRTISSVTDGTNSFTMSAVQNNGTAIYCSAGYVLAASAKSSATITATLSGNAVFRGIVVLQFRPDSGDTIALDGAISFATGSSTACQSGDKTTTGDDEVVVGFCKNYSVSTIESEQIGDINATGAVDLTTVGMGGWYRLLTNTVTNAHSQCAIGSSSQWVGVLVAIKATATGGASAVPVIMRSYRARR